MKKNIFSSYALLLALCAIVIGCANERDFQKVKVAPGAPMPSSATATTLAISSQVTNGGHQGTLAFTAIGSSQSQNFDGTDYSTTDYEVPSKGAAWLVLEKDTIDVEEFGTDIVGYPETTTNDTISETHFGEISVLEVWKCSDGNRVTGYTEWLCQKPSNYKDLDLPHGITKDLRFHKASLEILSERYARVTLSFMVDVKGVNSPSVTGAEEKEIKVSYIQRKPEPEPKGPTYDYSLTFSLKNEQLKGTFTVTGDNGFTATYPWTAAKVAKYQGQERLNVASTEAALHEQNVTDYPTENSTKTNERDGLQWETEKICKEIFQNRGWMSNGGGILPHPEKVYFYTTSVSVTLPDGRKVTAKIEQNTVFQDDVYAQTSSLIGDTYQLPNEDVTYTYNTTCTIVSDHYVTCKLVVDGEEKQFPIDCLEGGSLLHNTGDINLYTK